MLTQYGHPYIVIGSIWNPQEFHWRWHVLQPFYSCMLAVIHDSPPNGWFFQWTNMVEWWSMRSRLAFPKFSDRDNFKTLSFFVTVKICVNECYRGGFNLLLTSWNFSSLHSITAPSSSFRCFWGKLPEGTKKAPTMMLMANPMKLALYLLSAVRIYLDK